MRVSQKKADGNKNHVPPGTGKSNTAETHNSPSGVILHLQRTIGNRAVTRLIQTGAIQASLKIGQPGDIYEKEADRMAEQVMSMRMQERPPVQRQSSCLECEEQVSPKVSGDPETVPDIQLSRLRDYRDNKPEHDPSRLTDAEIEATNEYKAYMDPKLIWQKKDKVTREEALLACRLMLRHMRDGNFVNWKKEARGFMNRARMQLGLLAGVTSLGGDLSGTDSVEWEQQDITLKGTEFGEWLLAGGSEPDPKSGTMNCWEVILFGAYKKNFVSKSWLKTFYAGFTATLQATDIAGGDVLDDVTIENKLRVGKEYELNTADPDSPGPLPGDIVVFKTAVRHTAISLGTKTGGKHDVLSLWNRPDANLFLQKTTVEDLISAGADTPVKYWSPKWK